MKYQLRQTNNNIDLLWRERERESEREKRDRERKNKAAKKKYKTNYIKVATKWTMLNERECHKDRQREAQWN